MEHSVCDCNCKSPQDKHPKTKKQTFVWSEKTSGKAKKQQRERQQIGLPKTQCCINDFAFLLLQHLSNCYSINYACCHSGKHGGNKISSSISKCRRIAKSKALMYFSPYFKFFCQQCWFTICVKLITSGVISGHKFTDCLHVITDNASVYYWFCWLQIVKTLQFNR